MHVGVGVGDLGKSNDEEALNGLLVCWNDGECVVS